ncbi:hypothetical protein GCM10012275_02150 [Longimycelium tulufanense]|uniref:Barstar (barnase inhibitor) domain-containing protein n=1 Tax=Longimycelium tulufanense TaxID=907463 RepID=A0A8J3C5P2_9PSEU|nr:barstar family protein [Longimycelium tulufanense]GGM34372.1 hypothetical protein GCM10012275_02150 [Longimycelium tulufanense]
MTSPDLWTDTEPRLHVAPLQSQLPVFQLIPPPGTAVTAHLDGSKMTDEYGVLEQFNTALRFPVYFGWNWDALSDCLEDLNWCPAERYLLVVESAERVLTDEPDAKEVFYRILARAAYFWANPLGKEHNQPIPFNVLLLCNTAEDVATVSTDVSRYAID